MEWRQLTKQLLKWLEVRNGPKWPAEAEQCPWFGGWLRHRTSEPVNLDQAFLSENYSTPRQPNMWRCDSSLGGDMVGDWLHHGLFLQEHSKPAILHHLPKGGQCPCTHTSSRTEVLQGKMQTQSAPVTTLSAGICLVSLWAQSTGADVQLSPSPAGQAQPGSPGRAAGEAQPQQHSPSARRRWPGPGRPRSWRSWAWSARWPASTACPGSPWDRTSGSSSSDSASCPPSQSNQGDCGTNTFQIRTQFNSSWTSRTPNYHWNKHLTKSGYPQGHVTPFFKLIRVEFRCNND